MVAPRHQKAAVAILCMDRQMTAPATKRTASETNQPVRGSEIRVKACTARERVSQAIHEQGSYHDRHPEDIYITPRALARVLDCSEDTARRRLNFFDDQGILRFVGDAGEQRLFYELHDRFKPETDEFVPSQADIVSTTNDLFEALEEE